MEVVKVKRPRDPVVVLAPEDLKGLVLTFPIGTGARIMLGDKYMDIVYVQNAGSSQVRLQFIGPEDINIRRLAVKDFERKPRHR